MATTVKPGWSKPSTILFASEFPANEKAFAFALAQAAESNAELLIFHVYVGHSPVGRTATRAPQGSYATARSAKLPFEALVQRAHALGVRCSVVVRPGLPAMEILSFAEARNVDRLIIGAHTPGPIGKVLVGSVAEQVLRSATVPVSIVGPYVVEGAYRNRAAGTILCSVNAHPSSRMVAAFAAELAAHIDARLVVQRVIPPQETPEVLATRTLGEVEAELVAMVPTWVKEKLQAETRVVLGDPTEELLYRGRKLQASLIVMGAQGASHFAAITRAGVVYKVLAYARCPVVTLSPVMLADYEANIPAAYVPDVNFLAGVL
ncbi:MAG TPA: universal stress protein [Terracidiphilus sp.]|nr:universal stress protein [Terracidiphilus sp.]